MGFNTGSSIARPVIEATLANVPDPKARKAIYLALAAELNALDWDTQDEVLGLDPVWDELSKKHGWVYTDDDDE